MKKIFTTLAIFVSVASFAQTNGKVSGTVEDGSAKTIESATITLLKAKDSTIAKVAAADRTGRFEFDGVPEGKYMVSISAVGHEKGYSPAFDITSEKSSISLKTITLVPVEKSMSAVVVTAKKPLIEQRIDRTIVLK